MKKLLFLIIVIFLFSCEKEVFYSSTETRKEDKTERPMHDTLSLDRKYKDKIFHVDTISRKYCDKLPIINSTKRRYCDKLLNLKR